MSPVSNFPRPPRRLRALLCGGVGALAVACQGPARVEAFRVPREDFVATTRAIAVLPILQASAYSREAARAIEADIERSLATAGFIVLPAEAFQEAWAAEERAAGGVFDPRTGRLDQAKFAELRRRCYDELMRIQSFDAVLVPSFEVVSAPFYGGFARWDGSNERMVGTGELDARIEDYEGNLSALSLRVGIHDLEDRPLYEHRGGIQTLARIEGGEFVELEPDQVLVDPELHREAVRLALAPLLEER